MTSKERVIAAITFGRPDRIPTDVWCVPSVYLRYGSKVDDLIEKYPIDFARPKWDRSKMDPRCEAGTYEDEWGVVWDNGDNEGYVAMPHVHPLADLNKVDTYKLPFDRMPAIVDSSDIAKEPDKFWIGLGAEFFHRICWLRGVENVMMDLMYESAKQLKLRDMLLDYFMRQVKAQMDAGVDGVYFSDDFGTQRQLLIPPRLWRSFVKPVYKELFDACKKAGKLVCFHSDGYIVEIIEDLIEIGVDLLNCQVWCMGPKMLGKKFGGRIAFWGELNRQETLPHGTPDDIRKCAAEMKRDLATEKGGLIGQGEIDGLTRFENIEALLSVWY